MTTLATHTAAAAFAYVPPSSREALVAEYIGHILAGRPYPDALRAAAVAPRRPASVREGIAEMLGAPRH